MNEVTFKGWHAETIDFHNKMKPGMQIQLAYKFQYNVKYMTDRLCRCEMVLDAHHKEDSEIFGIHAVVIGLFSYEEGVSKESIHIQTYKELFPFARALLSNVSLNAGVPPILFPQVAIEKQSIIRFDMSGLKGEMPE